MVQDQAKKLLLEARRAGAQDIYLLPREEGYCVYLRVGDQRHFWTTFEFPLGEALLSHFKFYAGMNVGEKRRSQLGSCDYALESDSLSLRLSTVGDYRGLESLVIRLLYDGRGELAFWFTNPEEISQQIGRRGLYLFAGPVGSGKTSLMYQLAKDCFSDQQVLSIEDPVEIKDGSMLQLQLNPDIGMTYDHLIKLSLRHRPDLLIIGEIRDSETARAVVRAALTGITVFSTVHARSIPGVYRRLLELGVRREEMSQCLQLVVYQRLIGGKGLVDCAQKNFEGHDSYQWDQQVDQLLQSGFISQFQADQEVIGD